MTASQSREPQPKPFKPRPRLLVGLLAIFAVWLIGLFVLNQVAV